MKPISLPRQLPSVLLAPLMLMACAPSETRDLPPPSPAAEVIGEAKDCLGLTQFSRTMIRDDRTIDFIGPGDKVWRVTLPYSCPGLNSERAFTYETSLSQLCSSDIIYPLRTVGGIPERGAGCGMGKFTPVKLVM